MANETLVIELDVGPAFRGNAIAALTLLLKAQPHGPTWDVLKCLQEGLEASKDGRSESWLR